MEKCLQKESKAFVKGIDIEVVVVSDECVEKCEWRYRTCRTLLPFRLSVGKLTPNACLKEFIDCIKHCKLEETNLEVKVADVNGNIGNRLIHQELKTKLDVDVVDDCVEKCQWQFRICKRFLFLAKV
jgi:hypothetical protein